MIKVAYPWTLLVFALPFLIYYFFPKAKQIKDPALKVPFFSDLSKAFSCVDNAFSESKLGNLKYILLIIWGLVVVSASGIEWLGAPLPVQQSGRDLMLAIDLSGSMQTPDMLANGKYISRIDIVKKVANQFIKERSGDRLGLILFGTRPYLQTPLTFDRRTVADMLNDATIGIAGEQTAIGDALGLAVKQLLNYPNQSKALILLTDGGNNAGNYSPLEVAKLAKESNIKIYTIGLGAKVMQVQTLFGTQTINPSSDLDIETLQQIATITGGEFFRAEDGQSLAQVYAAINKLEPVQTDKVIVRPITPLFPWTLGLALLLSFSVVFINILRG